MPKEEKFMIVTESFAVDLDDGTPFVANAGKVMSADDPVVKKYPKFFRPLTNMPVEAATAAPGEKRTR
jgi:hypothetical protein